MTVHEQHHPRKISNNIDLSIRMDSSIQEVSVLLSAAVDQKLVQHLLSDVNHRLRIVSSIDVAAEDFLQSDVLIICHRYSEKTPAPQLPKGQIPSRLIVLSDCHCEQTITQTLYGGAHHYFDITESKRILSARLIAAMRNHKFNADDILEVSPFKFFVERRRVTQNDKPIHLSPREFALAYFLFSNNSRVVVDSELMVSIWTLPSSMDSRRIDTAICRIRKKMNLYENASGWNLHRLRQVGYQLLSDDAPVLNRNYLPDLSKCLLAPRAVPVHDQTATAAAGSTSCNVLVSNSTISPNSAPLAMNGGANRT